MTSPEQGGDASSGGSGRGFARKVATSLLVSGAGNAIGKLLNVAALFLVLKLLSPDELGTAQLVLAVFGILQSVTELGLGAALVQAKAPTRRQIDSLFWLSFGISILFYLVVLAGSPLLAWFYEDPELTPLLRVQGLAVVLFALYLVPRNLMTKDLQFGRLAIVDNVSLVVSSGGMIWLAWAGYGAWALIWAEVGNRVAQLVLCQLFRPHVPRLTLDIPSVRGMLSFGLYATGARLLYNFYINADYLVVGKLFGQETLGIYAFAYRVVSDPLKTLTSIVNQVAYPAFARLQTQVVRLKRYYFAFARINLTFIGLVLILICFYVDAVLVVIGYDQWRPAVPFVQAFALFGLVRCVSPLVPQLLNAVGQARLNFVFNAAGAVALPVAFLVGAEVGGPMGVAWAWGIAYPLLVMVLFVFGAAVLEMPLGSFTAHSFSGLLVLVPVSALAFGAHWLALSSADGPGWMEVVTATVTLTVGLGLGLYRERDTIAVLRARRTDPDAPAATDDPQTDPPEAAP